MITPIILDHRLISQEFNDRSTRRSKLNKTDDKSVIMRKKNTHTHTEILKMSFHTLLQLQSALYINKSNSEILEYIFDGSTQE